MAEDLTAFRISNKGAHTLQLQAQLGPPGAFHLHGVDELPPCLIVFALDESAQDFCGLVRVAGQDGK
jgi:hypothetical protein